MASYNRVIIMGNLTRDPEYRQLPSGQAVCRFGLASNRQFKNKQTGEMIQEVCFVDVDVWGPQADVCNQYLQKGKNVLVEGRLKLDSWMDNSGNKRSKHLIVGDRVTFLWQSTSAQESDQTQNNYDQASAGGQQSNHIDEVVSSSPVKTVQNAVSTKDINIQNDEQVSSTGEINFKDEKPFEDDLPF